MLSTISTTEDWNLRTAIAFHAIAAVAVETTKKLLRGLKNWRAID